MTTSEILNKAVRLHQSGDLNGAKPLYEQILLRDPNHADAHHLLGLIHHQQGREDEAFEEISRAIRARRKEPSFHANLGLVQIARRELKEAEASLRLAIQCKSNYPEAHVALGDCLQLQGKLEQAVASYARALQLRPENAAALSNMGNALLLLGRTDEAIAALEKSLAIQPRNPYGLTTLGNALRARGEMAQAAEQHRRALELNPNFFEAHNNLGNVYKDEGRLDEAFQCFQAALKLNANSAEVHFNLGNVFQAQKKLEEAAGCFQRATELNPNLAEAHNNLGSALQGLNKPQYAIPCCQRAIQLKPDYAAAHYNLGNSLRDLGRLAEAEACFRRAIELQPVYGDAYTNLGNTLKDKGQLEEAISVFHKAMEIVPGAIEARNSLGVLFKDQGKPADAIPLYEEALQVNPAYAEAHNNLGNAYKDQGKIDEALACFQKAADLKPSVPLFLDNHLCTLQYRPGVTLDELNQAHARFEERLASRHRSDWKPHGNPRDPGKKLRLGFVSHDLSRHPVGFFMAPLVEHLDREQCDVVCYSDRLTHDDITLRIQAASQAFHTTASLSDADLAEKVRTDGIDILVDLAGHTAKNRLLTFARKPAPVQISWMGYVGTVGVDAIDWIMADRFEIPVELEGKYRQRVLRLPDDYICFEPSPLAPDVGPLPALRAGRVTFGCFNNTAKLNAAVFQVWGRILARLPDSRIVLKYRGMDDPGTVRTIEEFCRNAGIDPARVECRGFSPPREFFATYNDEIDVALDPFPYAGGLTTCEALWMGVPVVTCPGDTFASRHSLSHLSNAGVTETIARSFDAYVDIAVGLGSDLPRLADLRARLRPQVAASPLCDAPRYAKNVEAVLREAWRVWCQQA